VDGVAAEGRVEDKCFSRLARGARSGITAQTDIGLKIFIRLIINFLK
jgi:hypothetical protein